MKPTKQEDKTLVILDLVVTQGYIMRFIFQFPVGEKKYKMTPGPEYNPNLKP